MKRAAVRIPSQILAQANLVVSSPISIDVKEGKIVIAVARSAKRKVNLPFREAFLLKGLDVHNAHADEVAQPSIVELGS